MRLHKVLAHEGLGSRRTIENWIREGRILVNGQNAHIGQSINDDDKIIVNGQFVKLEKAKTGIPRVLIYHKPEGEICSRVSEENKKTVFDNLPCLEIGRWVMVGRLDVNTSGLLLFTDQGELAHQLMHPRFNIKRQYAVRVIGNVTENILAKLKKGVRLPQGLCQFKEVVAKNSSSSASANQWYTVTLTEGKYREVRELWASQGCMVSRLIRIKYGNVSLPRDLRQGHYRELSQEEVLSLTV